MTYFCRGDITDTTTQIYPRNQSEAYSYLPTRLAYSPPLCTLFASFAFSQSNALAATDSKKQTGEAHRLVDHCRYGTNFLVDPMPINVYRPCVHLPYHVVEHLGEKKVLLPLGHRVFRQLCGKNVMIWDVACGGIKPNPLSQLRLDPLKIACCKLYRDAIISPGA